jgi:hypothetical protein
MVSAFASFKFGVAFAFTQLIAVLMVFYVSNSWGRLFIHFFLRKIKLRGSILENAAEKIVRKIAMAVHF